MRWSSTAVIIKRFRKAFKAFKKEVEETQNLITSRPALQKVHDDNKALAIPVLFFG